jgi:hypothetical protein
VPQAFTVRGGLAPARSSHARCGARAPPHAPASRLPLLQIRAPLVDLEVRGVPALSYFGSTVWQDAFEDMNAGSGRK